MGNRLTILSCLAQAITHPLALNSSNNLLALLASTQLTNLLTGISALSALLVKHAHKAQETGLALRTLLSVNQDTTAPMKQPKELCTRVSTRVQVEHTRFQTL